MGVTPIHIRPHKEFWEVIQYIRHEYMIKKQEPPSIPEITRVIAENIDKKEILRKGFIE